MKLSLWPSNRAETKAIESRSKASASTERQKAKGSGKKRPSSVKTAERYKVDDAPSRKRVSREKRDAPEDDRQLDDAYPLIDRVPTAMGYHSHGSEDEWLEEKSKCSRYSVNDDLDDDDEEGEREPMVDDEPDDSADRYSRKAAKEKKKKQKIKAKKEQPMTISRLWSESTDSDASPPQWGSENAAGAREREQPIPFDPGEVSYPEERGGDPIYDVMAKNKNGKSDVNATQKKVGKGPTIQMHPVSSMEAPGSPTAESDTSDLTDPLDNMLHFSATNKVVKEIEDKLKLLKKVAKDERAFAKKTKKAAAKGAKESKKTKSVQPKPKVKANAKEAEIPDTKAVSPNPKNSSTLETAITKPHEAKTKSEIVEPSVKEERGFVHRIFPLEEPSLKPLDTAKLLEKSPAKAVAATAAKSAVTKTKTIPVEKSTTVNMKKARSRDQIEMSRTVSLAESLKKPTAVKVVSRRPLRQSLSKRLPKTKSVCVSSAESTDKSKQAESKTTRDLTDMYTRSLLTEDSEFDLAKATESRDASENKTKAKSKLSTRKSTSTVNSRQRDKHAGCLSPGWKLSSQSKESDAASIKKNGSFWNKRASRASLPAADRKTKSKQILLTKGLQDDAPIERTKETQELDEYAGLAKETSNEANVVQCLRFYACGTVANQLNTVIRISECGGAGFQCGTDATDDTMERKTQNGKCSSPIPHVEVILEEGVERGFAPEERSGQPTTGWNPMVFHDDDEFLEEAPPLPLSRVPSIVVNVSGMQLHLDVDSETERQVPVSMVAGDPKSDVSITSIILPNQSSTRSIVLRESEDSEKYNEDEERELDEYIEGIKAKKGIRGLFARFRKS